MSEDMINKLKEIEEIYKLLTGKPDPEQEEQAQKDLLQKYSDLKKNVVSEHGDYPLIVEIYTRLEKWDPLESWFTEEKELQIKIKQLLIKNQIIQDTREITKETEILQKEEENKPETIEQPPAGKPVVRFRLAPPEIKIPHTASPKRKITPSTHNDSSIENEEPSQDQEKQVISKPIETQEHTVKPTQQPLNQIPKIKINLTASKQETKSILNEPSKETKQKILEEQPKIEKASEKPQKVPLQPVVQKIPPISINEIQFKPKNPKEPSSNPNQIKKEDMKLDETKQQRPTIQP